MISPDFRSFKQYAKEKNLLVLSHKFLCDFLPPVMLYLNVKRYSRRESFLLESVEGDEKVSRYSFIGFDPICIFRIKGNYCYIRFVNGRTKRRIISDNPLNELRCLMAKFKVAPLENIRFFGGFVGYLGYDCIRFFEPIGEKKINDLGTDDAYFILPKFLVIYDHRNKEVEILNFVYLDNLLYQGKDLKRIYNLEIKEINRWAKRIVSSVNAGLLKKGEIIPKLNIHSNFKRKYFLQAVKKIIRYIKEGEIIQAVISQRFGVRFSQDPFLVYRYLRILNPSAYMFYLNLGGVKVVGSSPEMLVRCDKGVVFTRPIAGTRRRGYNEEEDKLLEKELINDEKERAEHLMLVDLGRNDLGRISKKGSVEVPVFMNVERFSHVMHIVSEVQGILDEKYDMFDALKACFPAGTVTGAPKVRAMQIINELEPCARGIYAGSVGYFSFTGSMDMGIIIRTIIFKNKRAYVQAGAGIVCDSIPEREFKETVNKAKAQILALQMASK